MISYELAKRLKDAGFPQIIPTHSPAERYSADGISQHHWEHHTGDPLKEFNDPDAIKIPTLSELIEACGDDFYSLHRICNHNVKDRPGYIWVCDYDNDSEYGTGGWLTDGDSPEEAMTNLWLALNEK